MILTSRSGNRELRMFEGTGFIPSPGSPDAVWGGPLKTPALAVPAVACAVRLVSEEIASCVMRVYTGPGTERQPVYDAPQARLFQDPADGWTSFDVWSDTITALELERNAFLWKTKTKVGVEEIYPVDPDFVQVKREGGMKVIRARIEGRIRDITADVIHIRGWSTRPSLEGISTIELHRRPLRTAESYDEYRGRYFDNEGMPGILLEAPGSPDKNQRRDLLEGWAKRHGGPRNANKPGLVWGGVKATVMSPSLREAQAVEISDALVRDVARMFRIYPAELLHAAVQGSRPPSGAELWSDLFWRFSIMPRVRRVERAIAADREVFPDVARYPRFDVSEFIRGDIQTTATMVHNLVQVGVLTKNEGRAILGMGPVDGGDVLLETPVGGAPNPFPTPAPDDGDVVLPAPDDQTP